MKFLSWLAAAPFFLWCHSGECAYVLNQVGAGIATLTPSGQGSTHAFTSNFGSALQVNRSAANFGNTSSQFANVVEGAWLQYTFSVPTVSGNPHPNFDAQITMGGMWSGFGGGTNGDWQRGPTSSTWSRNLRYQHDYYDRDGANPTIRPGTDVSVEGHIPALNTSLALPEAGDVLRVLMVLNAITNEIEYTYSNLTTQEVFNFTIAGSLSGVPTSNLSFSSLAFRSDNGPITSMQYAYGTLFVVPEPSPATLLFLAFGMGFVLQRRR